MSYVTASSAALYSAADGATRKDSGRGEFLEGAEALLKTALGDLWRQNEEECREWLSAVSRYQEKLLADGRTEHSALTEKFLRAGTASLVRRMKGRAKDSGREVAAGLWAMTQDFLGLVLSIAVTAAIAKAEEKI